MFLLASVCVYNVNVCGMHDHGRLHSVTANLGNFTVESLVLLRQRKVSGLQIHSETKTLLVMDFLNLRSSKLHEFDQCKAQSFLQSATRTLILETLLILSNHRLHAVHPTWLPCTPMRNRHAFAC